MCSNVPIVQLRAVSISSDDESTDSSDETPADLSSLMRLRAQQAVPVRLAGMIVPFSHWLDVGDAAPLPVSCEQLVEAGLLLFKMAHGAYKIIPA